MTDVNQQPEMQPTQTARETASSGTSPQPKKQRRVGTFAFGLTLVAAGILLVAKTFVPSLDLVTIAKLSPAILVVLGIEVLVYAARPDVTLKYDFLSMFATALILLVVGGASMVPLAMQYMSPEWDGTISRMRSQLEQQVYVAVAADPTLKNVVHDASVNVYGDKYLTGDGRMVWDEESAYRYVYFTLNPEYQTAEEFAIACHSLMTACDKAGLNVREYQFDTWNNYAWEDPQPYFTLNVSGPWLADAELTTLVKSVNAQWYYRDGVYSSRAALEESLAGDPETTSEQTTYLFDGQELTEDELYVYLDEKTTEAYENGYQDGLMQSEQATEG